MELSRANRKLARDTLGLTQQKYDAGISTSVEVVQAQESVASSDLDYITALFAHNLAKLSLARAIGHAAETLPDYLASSRDDSLQFKSHFHTTSGLAHLLEPWNFRPVVGRIEEGPDSSVGRAPVL